MNETKSIINKNKFDLKAICICCITVHSGIVFLLEILVYYLFKNKEINNEYYSNFNKI